MHKIDFVASDKCHGDYMVLEEDKKIDINKLEILLKRLELFGFIERAIQ